MDGTLTCPSEARSKDNGRVFYTYPIFITEAIPSNTIKCHTQNIKAQLAASMKRDKTSPMSVLGMTLSNQAHFGRMETSISKIKNGTSHYIQTAYRSYKTNPLFHPQAGITTTVFDMPDVLHH